LKDKVQVNEVKEALKQMTEVFSGKLDRAKTKIVEKIEPEISRVK